MSARKKLIFPFLLPCLLLIGALFILPAINTFVISFQNWDGTFRTTDWNGLQNYAKLLKDPTFVEAVKHTFQYFLISMILLFPLALLLAVCLQRIKKGRMLIQFCIFMPVTLSVVVAAILWKWYIYDPNMGMVNTVLRAIGLEAAAKAWLGDAKTAMTCVILMSTWHGLATWVIMLISGLDRIPPELMEAARIDGANEFRVFIRITLPLLWEVLSSLIVMCFIGCMQQFPVVFAMTQGGPHGATELMGTYLYKIAFEGRQFSYGSAMAIVMLLTILVASVIGNRFLKTDPIEY